MDHELYHYGTPHVGDTPHSGRYQWGSGENPNQRGEESIYQANKRLMAEGLSERERAEYFHMSTTALRKEIARASNEERAANIHRAMAYKDHGYKVDKIAQLMGVPERTVYNWLASDELSKTQRIPKIAENLKAIVDEKEYVDVGPGTEYMLGTNKNAINNALHLLEQDGYSVQTVKVQNVTDPSKNTLVKVLCKPGTEWSYIQNHQELIQPFTDISRDGGLTLTKVQYPSSIDSSRVAIRYADQGGEDFDGLMYIRRGVDDLSLGDAHYAQVRIAVDGTHYLKGMALYSDDPKLFPDGIDIVFNTNKTSDVPKMKVLKPLKDSEDLPFGAVIPAKGQSYYYDKNGKYAKIGNNFELISDATPKDAERYSLSAVNKLKEEGNWNEYSKTLSAQMLSKQSISLIKNQLNLTYAEKAAEFDEIRSLTQPEIKRKLLLEFASDCDASAVDLKATALPGQTNKVILPLDTIKDNQIFAPGYENGTKVALIRYPHAGLFEIPILTVNNNAASKKILGNTPIDAVGITSASAKKLSGADFDGDTVVVIPLSDKVNIQSQKSLFDNFEPTRAYPGYPGMKVMTSRQKGLEMGLTSNLITDMTLKGASPSELARVVKHSMVVIDAQKHELNWKLSEQENGIAALKKEYQGKATGGSSTLISRASSRKIVDERKQFNPNIDIDKETGEIIPRETNRYFKKYKKLEAKNPETGEKEVVYTTNQYGKKVPVYATDKDGNMIFKEQKATQSSTKMAEVKDAFALSSGTKKEEAYAIYANSLKALANKARLEYVNTSPTKSDPAAKKTYAKQVESLTAKLKLAELNAPKERMAQIFAAHKVRDVIRRTNLDDEEEKKLRQQALSSARAQFGANKKDVRIVIEDDEWEAIMNNALSSQFLTSILSNTDTDALKKRATPKVSNEIPQSTINLIKSRANSGFTLDEIARSLGVSVSTVSKYIKE